MCWRLTIDEFAPELIYIPGNKNIVADALSCLPLDEATSDNQNNGYYCADLLALSKDNLPPQEKTKNFLSQRKATNHASSRTSLRQARSVN